MDDWQSTDIQSLAAEAHMIQDALINVTTAE